MPEIQLALKKGNIEVNELMNLLDHDNSGKNNAVARLCFFLSCRLLVPVFVRPVQSHPPLEPKKRRTEK